MLVKKIMVIAGEPSGDLHGSNLARSISSISPQTELFGIGGEKMRAAGVNTFHDIKELSIVGVFDVLRNIAKIKSIFKDAVSQLETKKPDTVVLIDYPGFNLELAKKAKQRGVRVIYYISPQIWAWAPGRINAIKKCVDKMLVAFEFEKKIYESAGVPVEFVGYPLLDVAKPAMDKDKALDYFGLKKGVLTIGFLPGSRKSEVEKHLPAMLGAAAIIKDNYAGEVQFAVSKSPILSGELYLRPSACLPCRQTGNLRPSAF
ncbi:MAG: lipid-A-disaccharide synthase, partial [Candidatus Omnitrophota bacterium]